MTNQRLSAPPTRLDDAARAGWLYYVAGNTQDEIAQKLGVSRQTAQRLVAMAVAEKLVKVRLDHPIGHCMDLAAELTDRFGLRIAEVVPSDPGAPDLLAGVASAAAALLERTLRHPEPQIIALGTGRALKATVEALPRMDCPQHRIVSRLGNMMANGQATAYNAVVRMADRVGAPHYPCPLPVLVKDPQELGLLHAQEAVRHTLALCAEADLTLVGIGQMNSRAPLFVDGFVSQAELEALVRAGAAGEITSWVFDGQGQLIHGSFNARVASAPLSRAGEKPFVAVAVGEAKVAAIRAALAGCLVNGLVTNEATASSLLASS
ncbi:Transcriptional regulator of mannitol utilization, DeoR family protein [Rubellimicrobium mesophilum DSM 19309]|uniref:Transcriptional regulator of mannitol utilization, DeoR family protein n=1 Tax=Rubellimicrobium mesophilum DSM 19309 TaxID=442562 RepID=A0A017HVK9_9RHOB|nr:sugar-binding transcriptional regulator [Rubellimicrobium mesophilum]EYD78188.1 Transcriptional regulator of mannitol utilization, DeoR family protein [Rubellimicrobium mesophilum DSM 19309]